MIVVINREWQLAVLASLSAIHFMNMHPPGFHISYWHDQTWLLQEASTYDLR